MCRSVPTRTARPCRAAHPGAGDAARGHRGGGGAERRPCPLPAGAAQPASDGGGDAASAASSTSVDNGSGLKVDPLNVQSLLPKLPDIRADLSQQKPDVTC